MIIIIKINKQLNIRPHPIDTHNKTQHGKIYTVMFSYDGIYTVPMHRGSAHLHDSIPCHSTPFDVTRCRLNMTPFTFFLTSSHASMFYLSATLYYGDYY